MKYGNVRCYRMYQMHLNLLLHRPFLDHDNILDNIEKNHENLSWVLNTPENIIQKS